MSNTKQELTQDGEKLLHLIEQAYELAGSMRDTFSSWPDSQPEIQGYMKERCNSMRGLLYELKNDARLLNRAISKQP